jgi:hypothetical protein
VKGFCPIGRQETSLKHERMHDVVSSTNDAFNATILKGGMRT